MLQEDRFMNGKEWETTGLMIETTTSSTSDNKFFVRFQGFLNHCVERGVIMENVGKTREEIGEMEPKHNQVRGRQNGVMESRRNQSIQQSDRRRDGWISSAHSTRCLMRSLQGRSEK